MTVSILDSFIEYVGNGITTAFDFPFLIPEDDDIQVYNVIGDLKYAISASSYSVSGIGNPTGGAVTFVVAPIALYRIRIERQVPFTQPAHFAVGGGIAPSTVELSLDRSTLQIQQLANLVAQYTDLTDSIVDDVAGLLAGRIDVPLVASVSALRAGTYTGLTSLYLMSWISGLGLGGGMLRYDPADIVSADDSVTVFVSADAKRWKRVGAGPIDITWAGANPDNATDARAAIVLADAAATALNTKVMIPVGTFYVASGITLVNEVVYHGRIRLNTGAVFRDANPLRLSDYKRRYSTDQDAFESMLKDCYFLTRNRRVLFGEGLSCIMTRPTDVATATGLTVYSTHHAMKDFNWAVGADLAFTATVTTTKTGGGAVGSILTLNNTTSLRRGMLVTGPGVPVETYIVSVDSATQITINVITLSIQAAQTYTFKDFQYMLDFRNMETVQRCRITSCNFACSGVCSGISLAKDGIFMKIQLTSMTNLLDRGITEWFAGGSSMLVQGCHIGFDTSAGTNCSGITMTSNDFECNATYIAPPHGGWNMVLHGSGNTITGCHITGDDNVGIYFTGHEFKSLVTGCYIDNCYIVFGDEATNTNSRPIRGLTITGCIFTAGNARLATFRFIIAKITGITTSVVNGILVTGNVFKQLPGGVGLTRVDAVDTSLGGTPDPTSFLDVIWKNNTFENIVNKTQSNPTRRKTQGTVNATWTLDFADLFPFGGIVNQVVAVVLDSPLQDGVPTITFVGFYTLDGRSSPAASPTTSMNIKFGAAYKGSALVTVDCNVAL